MNKFAKYSLYLLAVIITGIVTGNLLYKSFNDETELPTQVAAPAEVEEKAEIPIPSILPQDTNQYNPSGNRSRIFTDFYMDVFSGIAFQNAKEECMEVIESTLPPVNGFTCKQPVQYPHGDQFSLQAYINNSLIRYVSIIDYKIEGMAYNHYSEKFKTIDFYIDNQLLSSVYLNKDNEPYEFKPMNLAKVLTPLKKSEGFDGRIQYIIETFEDLISRYQTICKFRSSPITCDFVKKTNIDSFRKKVDSALKK